MGKVELIKIHSKNPGEFNNMLSCLHLMAINQIYVGNSN